MIEALMKRFDGYNRKARVYPAVIAILPAIWTGVALLDGRFSWNGGGLVVLSGSCVLFLMATVARARGTATEKRLLMKWGEWPTTISLRHRDMRIDQQTKARYHATLDRLTDDRMAFPDAAEEERDPHAADAIYRSATKQFLELRRGPEYQRIHDENAWYGFRRNLRGLKWPAVLLAIAIAGITTAVWLHRLPALSPRVAVDALFNAPLLPALVGADVIFAFAIGLFVTDEFVLQAGYDYADALLRSIDTPPSTVAAAPSAQ